MRSLACRHVVPACGASWLRATDDEILAEVATHATEAHGLTSVPDCLVDEFRRHIVDCAG